MASLPRDKGHIFNIQRYSVHDGPGIRTVVFLKGCPLACPWCSNPESQKLEPELAYFENSCVGCLSCVKTCPISAISPSESKKSETESGGYVRVDRELCNMCGKCVQTCKNNAMRISGKLVSAAEVLEEVLKDKLFYRRSEGGMTLSGGEPTLQREFAETLLSQARNMNINTAVETCGVHEPDAFIKICELVDFILFDLKALDNDLHRRIVGAPNDIILRNLKTLIEMGRELIIRIPIIPGYTDSEKNVREISESLSELLRRTGRQRWIRHVDLVPYHRLGEHKYRALGRAYALKGTVPPNQQQLENLMAIVSGYGLDVQIGG